MLFLHYFVFYIIGKSLGYVNIYMPPPSGHLPPPETDVDVFQSIHQFFRDNREPSHFHASSLLAASSNPIAVLWFSIFINQFFVSNVEDCEYKNAANTRSPCFHTCTLHCIGIGEKCFFPFQAKQSLTQL